MGDDEALKNCPPPKKEEVCGNADSGDEPPELLVHPSDEKDTKLEHEQPELLVRPGNQEEMDYNDICGSCSSVNTNDHVVVEDVFSGDGDSSVHRFVYDGCVSNRTEIDLCHSLVFGEEELNQRSKRRHCTWMVPIHVRFTIVYRMWIGTISDLPPTVHVGYTSRSTDARPVHVLLVYVMNFFTL
jgi:hypothetical protein